MIFLLLCLTSLSMTISRSIHVGANAIMSFFKTHLCILIEFVNTCDHVQK